MTPYYSLTSRENTNLITQLENLHIRTDVHIFFVAVRSQPTQYNHPYVFYTDDRVPRYLEQFSGGKTVDDLATGLEGFCISGVQSK